MKKVRIIAIIFSFILLAAHFKYKGYNALLFVSIVMPFLLYFKKSYINKILSMALFLGGIEWVITMYDYVYIRINCGDNWIRLALILSMVSIFTFYSSYLRHPLVLRLTTPLLKI